ncbi:carboxypeptidase-like regulatory domain-containing protein [Sphingobacterium hungaricum]|uniref:Carboxypeptidase regulatory-like domain-containing protein n=1 Tax=Sphingobacterium hungaricum TaxID=2082723 RepID=A0A928V1V4_9SPHI|nr:carboxypeptidase-like regulatory domain-containing protein [Sphingobacterium hungaricum]MBE8714604.1 carboxypeptidase regulatory-like domain-containing protein [Sphingobacterium hungaricum]
MKKHIFSLYFLLFLFALPPAQAQQTPAIPINTVVEKVQKFFTVYPVEKISVHFDKPYYAIGDTLWFKTYLGRNLVEYDPSKIAYVEVLNSKDSLIQVMRVPLKDGAGNGHLVLDPQFLSQDNYRFRAYTKWMANFDQGFFFNKIIPVGDAINKKLSTNITFEADGSNRTKALLQFRDRTGTLLSRKKITWEANDGWDAFDKGKGETDDMGRLTVSLNSKNKELLTKGRLVVKIENDKLSPNLVGDFSLSNALVETDVQFFPEGGDLISGIAKNVAFKAVSSNGKGLAAKGKIINSKKETVAEFADLGLGMGVFSMMPISGETYKAVVSFENGQEKTVDLPAVVDKAVNLIAPKQDDTSILVGVVTNESHFATVQNQPFYILAQSNGHLVYGAQASLKNTSMLIKIPKEGLPNGIVQITLMTADGKPVSERLVFLENEKLLDIQVKSDKDNYARKDAVNLNIAVNKGAEQIPGTYSVSVIDESKVPYDDDNDNSIVSALLLTSDIKGYIEKPNYYFNTKHENRLDALDALLMTQGFRRFAYADLIAEKLPEINFLPEQGISLSGTLRLNTGRTFPNGGLLLSVPARALRKDVYTDANGRFTFDNLVFPDSSKVTISARGNDNFRSLVINMDQTFFPAIDQKNPYAANNIQNIDQDLTAYLTNSKNEFRTSILIDEVLVTAPVVKQVTSKDFSALSGLSMADHRIDASRLSGCNILTMCLNTMLTGIVYDTQTLKYYVSRNYNQGSRVPVQFFLNGMPIDEPSLNSIQTADIEAIEIFLRDDLGTVSRTYQNDGVVSIMTKKEKKQPRMSLAEIESLLPKSNVIDMFPLGYVKERIFYYPKYTEANKNVNDYRTTIFWNPEIQLNEQGEATVNFYNADGTGKYKVVVEGMDQTGNIGRTIYYYNVN